MQTTPPLSLDERQALAMKAVASLSDEALQKLVRDGGLKKIKEDVKRVQDRVVKMGEGVESLVAMSLLAQAYMNERKELHERKQQGLPARLRQPMTAADLYPKGFSMEQAREEAKVHAPSRAASAPRRRSP